MLIRWLRDYADSKAGSEERIADVLGGVFVEVGLAVELPDPRSRRTCLALSTPDARECDCPSKCSTCSCGRVARQAVADLGADPR